MRRVKQDERGAKESPPAPPPSEVPANVRAWLVTNKSLSARPCVPDGVFTYGPGKRDPMQPFGDYLDGLIDLTDARLAKLGYASAKDGRWTKIKRMAPKFSHAWKLANLSGVLQETKEYLSFDLTKPALLNLALQYAFDAGREAAFGQVGRALGDEVAKSRSTKRAQENSGKNSAKRDSDNALCEMRRLIEKGKSMRTAAANALKKHPVIDEKTGNFLTTAALVKRHERRLKRDNPRRHPR